MTRFAMMFPAAARPYPGEGPGPETEAPSLYARTHGRDDRAGAHGCTSLNKAGQPCSGNAGPDGRCARHKAR